MREKVVCHHLPSFLSHSPRIHNADDDEGEEDPQNHEKEAGTDAGGDLISSPSQGAGRKMMTHRISIVPITVDPSKLIYRRIDEVGLVGG